MISAIYTVLALVLVLSKVGVDIFLMVGLSNGLVSISLGSQMAEKMS
jgi:hypothetical protein